MKVRTTALVGTRPDGSRIEQSITADNLLTVIERLSLAPIEDATWVVTETEL